MKKFSLLTLAFIMGASLNVNASTNVSIDMFKTSITASNKKLPDLIEVCNNIENEFNLTLNCNSYGKSELKKVMEEALKKEDERIKKEFDEEVRKEKFARVNSFVVKLNEGIVYTDYMKVCEAMKKAYPDCKMPEDCEDSSIETISSQANECLYGISGKSSNCNDYINITFNKSNVTVNGKSAYEITISNTDNKMLTSSWDIPKNITMEELAEYDYIYSKLVESKPNIKEHFTKKVFDSCIYKSIQQKNNSF